MAVARGEAVEASTEGDAAWLQTSGRCERPRSEERTWSVSESKGKEEGGLQPEAWVLAWAPGWTELGKPQGADLRVEDRDNFGKLWKLGRRPQLVCSWYAVYDNPVSWSPLSHYD